MPTIKENATIASQKKSLLNKACVLYFLILGALDKSPISDDPLLHKSTLLYKKNHGALIQKNLNQAAFSAFKQAIIQGNQQADNASLYLYPSSFEKELINNPRLHALFEKELGDLNSARTKLHESVDLYQRNGTRSSVLGVATLITVGCIAGGFFFPPLWIVSIAVACIMVADIKFDFLVLRNIALHENSTQYNQTAVSIDLIDQNNTIVMKSDIQHDLIQILKAEKTTTTSILEALNHPETTHKSNTDLHKKQNESIAALLDPLSEDVNDFSEEEEYLRTKERTPPNNDQGPKNA